MSNIDENITLMGIVYKKYTAHFDVLCQGRLITCTPAKNIRLADPRRQNKSNRFEESPIAIGDQVSLKALGNGAGVITGLQKRRNQLSRQAAGTRPDEQVIAANIDQVIPVFAIAQPAPKWNLLDRYLVSAEAQNLPALICITKLDLLDGSPEAQAALEEILQDYRRAGYPVLLFSSHTNQGVEEMRQALQGKISVLMGKSGVGKTSLLNAIQPGLGRRVSQVSDYNNKGRHTTTCLEMIPLEKGGAIIDTPGTREFGLWDIDTDELALYFPEMRPHLGLCKFGLDCHHNEEPGCAIRKAVTSGLISPFRYQSYLRLREDA
jgi:ribosome biogenesis GTPase